MSIEIINLTPHKERPVPEVGKEYHIFDDGKIRESRHYLATIKNIIPFNKIDKKIKFAWKKEVKDHYWLFAEETDYFIVAQSDYDKNDLYFVRTKDGGWFSIDYPNDWMGARLDIDGSLYEILTKSFVPSQNA